MTYEGKINILLETLDSESDDRLVSTITKALGCATCAWEPGDGFKGHNSRQPAKSDEPVVVASLVRLALWCVRVNDNSRNSNLAILEGFVRNDRWRACLTDSNSAGALAHVVMSVARYIQIMRPANKSGGWPQVAEPVVCKLLNAWLEPAVPYTESPAIDMLVPLLFGSDWLAVASALVDMSPGDLVTALRPPVLPSLLTAPQHLDEVKLPDLS